MNLSNDWNYIEQVAKARLSNNKTKHHRYDFGTEIEVIGAAGELLARRYLGLSEQLHLTWDGGIDFTFNGLRVDVKTTALTKWPEHRYLQWPRDKKIAADVILMCAVDINKREGVLLGFATRNEVMASPVNHDRKYPCKEYPVSLLRPAWHLVSFGKLVELKDELRWVNSIT